MNKTNYTKGNNRNYRANDISGNSYKIKDVGDNRIHTTSLASNDTLQNIKIMKTNAKQVYHIAHSTDTKVSKSHDDSTIDNIHDDITHKYLKKMKRQSSKLIEHSKYREIILRELLKTIRQIIIMVIRNMIC